jgi:hypothetical protein
MTTNNTNATYTFVHPVISKDSYAVSKLLPMVTFSEWDNKEAILATFTFLQEYNITTIKADVPIFKCDEEERQYRKDIFPNYHNWIQYVYGNYRKYPKQSDVGHEGILIFSQAKKAALAIMRMVRNEDLVVMTKEEFNAALTNAKEAGRTEGVRAQQKEIANNSDEELKIKREAMGASLGISGLPGAYSGMFQSERPRFCLSSVQGLTKKQKREQEQKQK